MLTRFCLGSVIRLDFKKGLNSPIALLLAKLVHTFFVSLLDSVHI